MMSCKRATEQMSQKLDAPLSLIEKMSLGAHLMMCGKCSRCQKQLEQLHRVCQKRSESGS